MQKEIITAAFLMIGDEILSGRTQDKNLNFLAKSLTNFGIQLREVRVVGDVEDEIILATKTLCAKYDYLFTSGGIGPTHDDITSAAIAKAFDTKLILHEEAEKILKQHYGDQINEARLKMAYIPQGASLLDNPVSSAPGFNIKNVFVMAGVPKIFESMYQAAEKQLMSGAKIKSLEIVTDLTEGWLASDLEKLQQKYQKVAMGSYPFNGGTSLVFRSTNYEMLEKSHNEMVEILKKIKSNNISNIA